MRNIIAIIISIALAQAAGLLGSFATTPAIPTWYAGLAKPAFAPPNWVFGPVWIVLYTLMGVAAYRIWKKRHEQAGVKTALGFYGLQLALNTTWSFLFFSQRNPGLAFFEIILLLAAIIWTAALFYKIERLAAYLLLPYIAWVGFAGFLNFAIWRLNS